MKILAGLAAMAAYYALAAYIAVLRFMIWFPDACHNRFNPNWEGRPDWGTWADLGKRVRKWKAKEVKE